MGPCLVNAHTKEVIQFGDKIKFEIGRSQNNDLNIPTVAISRLHCLITYSPIDEQWKLMDLSSFKSTRVNGQPVATCGTYLFTGDKISFVNLTGYEYIFNLNDVDSESQSPPGVKRRRMNRSMTPEEEINVAAPSSEKLSTLEEQNSILRAENNDMWKELKELKEKFKKLEEEHEKKTNDLILNQVVTEELKSDLESACLEIDLLASERNTLTAEVQTLKTGPILPSADGDEIHRLWVPGIVKSLEMDALQRNLQEKDEELREVRAKLDASSGKEKVLADALLNILDQEFLCCICNEVLLQPVVLNCKHTVCRECLETWKKNKRECPECRTKITVEAQPLLFDRYVDRIAPLLSDDFVKKREDVKKERQTASAPVSRGGVGARRRTSTVGRSRRGTTVARGRRRGVIQNASGVIPRATVVDLTS